MDLFVVRVALLLTIFVFSCSLYVTEGGKRMSKEELLEIENELNLLNKPFVKTINTKYGEIYDCVDFYKQPAFDHPLLKNHTFHHKMRPSLIPRMTSRIKVSEDHMKIGLNSVDCPIGTVPIRRTTRDDIIRAKLHLKTFGSKYNGLNRKNPGYHYAIAKTKFDGLKKYTGAGTEMSVWNPVVKSSHQYSSARLKIQNGQDSIEAGWTVNPTLYGHNKTRAYVYLNAGQSHCFNTRCPGFVVVNKDFPIETQIKDQDMSRKGERVMLVRIVIQTDTDGNWWLTIGDKLPIGFWPRQIFTGLSDSATIVEWGGEVFSPRKVLSPEMGSGEPSIRPHIAFDAMCRALSTIEKGGTTLKADTNTELYNDDSHYDIQDVGFRFSGSGHTVFFGGSGGAM